MAKFEFEQPPKIAEKPDLFIHCVHCGKRTYQRFWVYIFGSTIDITRCLECKKENFVRVGENGAVLVMLPEQALRQIDVEALGLD